MAKKIIFRKASPPPPTTDIYSNGITWTVQGVPTRGQFITGDWWVEPVTVLSVNPAPTGSGSTRRNGSMINPIGTKVGGPYHGYDGRVNVSTAAYSDNVSKSFPLDLVAGQSLISTKSTAEGYEGAYDCANIWASASRQKALRSAAVLTCLASPPSSTAFRPPFAGSEKPLYDYNNINWGLLPNLSHPGGSYIEQWGGMSAGLGHARVYERPWIGMTIKGDTDEALSPIDNSEGYYDSYLAILGDCGLLACCSISDKQAMVRNFIQFGIDQHYAIKTFTGLGSTERAARKTTCWPGIFAGFLLGNSEMLNRQYGLSVAPKMKIPDCCVAGTGWTHAGRKTVAPIALWNREDNDTTQFEADDPWIPNTWMHLYGGNTGWRLEGYRRNSHSWNFIGVALAARILGIMSYFGNDSFFNYADRWMTEDESGFFTDLRNLCISEYGSDELYTLIEGWMPSSGYFTKKMWDAYRTDY